MSTLTCDQVDELLDLYVSDACTPGERQAVEEHLAACPACPANLDRARQLRGLLDLHYQMPDRLARLQRRLRHEPLGRRLGQGVVRRFAALAALLLLTLGLAAWLLPTQPDVLPGLRLTASLTPRDSKLEMVAPKLMRNPAGHELPRFDDLDVRLTLSNTGPRPIHLDLAHAVLRFTLTDPGGRSARGTLQPTRALAEHEEVTVQPGDKFELHLDQFDRKTMHERDVPAMPGEYKLLLSCTVEGREEGSDRVGMQTLRAPRIRFSIPPGAP